MTLLTKLWISPFFFFAKQYLRLLNILANLIFTPVAFERVLAFFCIQSGLIWSLCSQKICYFYSLLGYCSKSIKHCYWLAPVGPVSTSALWVYLDVFLLKMLLIILGFITDFWQFSVSLTTFPLFLTIFLWFHEFLVLLLAYFLAHLTEFVLLMAYFGIFKGRYLWAFAFS